MGDPYTGPRSVFLQEKKKKRVLNSTNLNAGFMTCSLSQRLIRFKDLVFFFCIILKVVIEFVTLLFLLYVLAFWQRDVGFSLPHEGLNPHPLQWKAKS